MTVLYKLSVGNFAPSPLFIADDFYGRALSHIRRFQKYFNHALILIGISTLQFLKFWYQNAVNILFLVVKSIEVTSGFILRLMKKIARWCYHWNIWHLSVKTKISPLVVRYQKFNGCQKNWQDLRNLELEVYCANNQQSSTFNGFWRFFEVHTILAEY